MVVDIEKGDTFGACGNKLYQYRTQSMRSIMCELTPMWEPKVVAQGERTIPLDRAVKWIEGMGHTVQHTAPTPAYPVVRVADCTHGVRFKTGGISRLGSEADAKRAFDNINDVPGCACEVVALDWTGVGGNGDTEPFRSTVTFTTAPFKVGDVVRGKVVEELWMVKHPGPITPAFYFGEEGARANIARNGTGTLTRVAVVEVSEGETK